MLRLGAKRVRQRTNRCRTSARRCGPRSTGRGGALSPPVVLGLMDVLWGPTCVSARARIPRRGVFGRTHRSAPTRGGEVFRNQRELAWNRALAERRARQRSPPKGPSTPGNPSVTAKPCQLLLYLRHGLRQSNFVPKFGASVKSSAPTEGLSKSQQRADVGIGPYGCGGLGRLGRSCGCSLCIQESFLRGEKNERGGKAWPCPLGCLWGSLTSGRC